MTFACRISVLLELVYISVEIPVHIQIFIPVKASYFLKGVQQSGWIIEITI